MAGSIKGIIVEIGGDTSNLQKALSKVNSSTASLSKELKGVNSLLKLDPKNTELTAQKQTILKQNIEQTSKKIEELRKAQEMADETIANGGEISQENYRNLQREIINTENKLKNLKVEASKWTTAGRSIEEFGNKITNISSKIDKMGTTLTTRLTLPIVGITTTAIASMDEVDEGLDTVATKTGATGVAAKELQEIYKQVASEVPGEFGDIGAAVGEINTRLDFTGDKLKTASVEFLKFAKVNGTDVNSSVQLVTRAMGDAGIKAEDYASLLDMLTVAGQKSGISIEALTTNLAKYGAPMRALGIDTKNAIAMFAGWEKAGVNTEIAFSGMKKAISNWGAAGKDSTKEFSKTLDEIAKCPDLAKATTKAIEVFGAKAGPDLADAIKGGRFEFQKYVDALDSGSGTLENTYKQIVDEVDDTQLAMQNAKIAMHDMGETVAKSLGPILLDLSKQFKSLMERFDKLSDKEKKQIINIGLIVAAIGPAIKILGKLGKTVGTGVRTVGTFSQAISLMGKTSTQAFKEASTGTQNLARGLTALTSPVGLITTAVTIATATIAIAIKNAEKETKEAFSNMGTGATEFITGINNATSHLDSFNSTLFTSSQEQQKLQEDMNNVQQGITQICKRASDERRGYTQEELTQLDEYFNKLRELKNRELEIQQSIGTAITQQAQQEAQSFQGSLAEYKVKSAEMIKTAQEQKDNTIKIIQDGTTQQIALLNQKYKTEEERQSEAYLNEYNELQRQKEEKIAQANEEVAKVTEAYNNGYTERLKNEQGWYELVRGYNSLAESENSRHQNALEEIENKKYKSITEKNGAIDFENSRHLYAQQDIWKRLAKDMSEEDEKELGSWLIRQAQTELYGGKISDENKKMVDSIMDNYDKMPPETKKIMEETMKPMLEEMENKEPSLYAKASSIAGGILSRLKTSFDVHSPSRETRKIFKNVMKGAELGLQDEENRIYKQIDKFSTNILDRLNNINISDLQLKTPKIQDFGKLQGNLSNEITNTTKTIFTTPQIVFNVQELDKAKLDQCFNYVNKKFGSAY